MEKRVYIAAIAQTCSGDLFNCILWARTEEELVDKVNDFFKEEDDEGHPVYEDDKESIVCFDDIQEIDGLNITDAFGDREYDIVTATVNID